jgi:FkbM family methyltransferase
MLIPNIETLLKERRGAIHVGANDGGERDWYVKNGFDPVIWFEPDPNIYSKLCSNLKDIKYSNHFTHNIGIHDTLKNAVLNVANNSGQSSSILHFGTHATSHPKVHYIGKEIIQLERLDHFLDINNYPYGMFNFLNIDVQGVELNVIKSLGCSIDEFDYIYTEVNTGDVYKECCLLSDIDLYLKSKNFTRVAIKMTRNDWGDAFYMKNTLI